MAGDLLIKNGTVVDGSGRPRRRGDVAIRDGKFIEPESAKAGARVIDAEGKVVAPGFLDVHTHYDAQVLWDSACTCSPWHGFTTVIMGNCGFTLAPTRPQDRDFMMEMFGRVEGMNVAALRKGLDWAWETYPEYLTRVQRERLGINIGAMIGHSAVRRYVLGEAAAERAADADEVQRMKGLVREGLQAGAFGFTTSLSPTHYDSDGRPVPSRLASHEEVIELGSALREFGVGSIEVISKTAVTGPKFEMGDQQLMIELSRRSGRPVNWNELSQSPARPNVWRDQIAFMERAAREGAQVYAVARCQRLDTLFNLTVVSVFERMASWKDTLSRPKAEIMHLLRDPDVRQAMKSEAHAVEKKINEHARLANVTFLKSKTGAHAGLEQLTLAQIAARTGKDFVDVLIDISLAEDLEAEFGVIGRVNGDAEAVAELIQSPYSLAGLSDAGAHTDRISGSYFSTYLLTRWVRDEQAMTLEDAVRRLTSMPASVYGITDRGLIQSGMAGDAVIFDLPRLKWLPSERLNDLPGGEMRLTNGAEGYEQLIVGGEVAFEGGRETGAHPGRLLRSSTYRP